jgi:hypothetical protein
MPDADRALAERIHALVLAKAPELLPKTWYGMPAYADTDEKVFASSRRRQSQTAAMPSWDSKMQRRSTTPRCGRLSLDRRLDPTVEKRIGSLITSAVA